MDTRLGRRIGGGFTPPVDSFDITWTPIQLTPNAWFRADNVLNPSGVSQFTDLTASAAHFTQGTVAARPTLIVSSAAFNNQPVISFDGTDDSMNGPVLGWWTLGANATCLIVARFPGPQSPGDPILFAGTRGSSEFAVGRNGGIGSTDARSYDGTQDTTGEVGGGIGTAARFEFVLTGGTLTYTVNNTSASVASGNITAGVLASGQILGSNGTEFSIVEIAEMVCLNKVITAEEYTTWKQYCNYRYGISA